MSTPARPPALPLDELRAQIAECAWALSLSEDHLRAVLSAAPDAIITIDHRGTVLMANPAVSRLFGYQPHELVGQNVKVLMPPDERLHHDEYLDRYQQTRQPRIIGIGREVTAQRKDGSQFPAELTVAEVDHLNLFVGFVRDISRRRHLEREILEVAGREQRRISQDLHDSVGQELTALALLSAELEQALRQDHSGQAGLAAKIAQGVRRTLEEVRAISRGLNPVPIDKAGLMSALEDLVQRLSQQTKAHCEFRCPRPVNLADNLAATQLFQVAQEATTNALKHARPKRLEICLERDDHGRVILRITDDGVGLPATATAWPGGVGLRTMRNRAQILGAELTIARGPKGGTQITCIVPKGHHVQDSI